MRVSEGEVRWHSANAGTGGGGKKKREDHNALLFWGEELFALRRYIGGKESLICLPRKRGKKEKTGFMHARALRERKGKKGHLSSPPCFSLSPAIDSKRGGGGLVS